MHITVTLHFILLPTDFRGMIHVVNVVDDMLELVLVGGMGTATFLLKRRKMLTCIFSGTGKFIISEFPHSCPIEPRDPLYFRVCLIEVERFQFLNLGGRVVIECPVLVQVRFGCILREKSKPRSFVAIGAYLSKSKPA